MKSKIRRFDFLDQLEIFEASDYQPSFPLHSHDTVCLTLLLRGTECTQVHQQELMTPFKSISLTYPDEIHANPNKNKGSYSFLTYYISPDVLAHFHGNEKYYFNNRIIQDDYLSDLLFQFAQAPEASESTFKVVLDYFIQHHFTNRPNHTIGEKLTELDYSEVVDFIDQKFAERLSIEQLAKMKNLSRFSFIRQFKKAKGITPSQYITLKRIQAAKQLLRKGLPIVDAVYNTGFYDQSHMSRNFKKLTGMTPRSYQQACNIVQEF